MSITIIRPKTRAEWLIARDLGIGSSEVATIIGLNPWETPYQLWRRKIGLDAPKEETFLMKAGHYLEDAVAKFWQDTTGREVIKRSTGDWLIRNNERPHIQVSPDRTYWIDSVEKRNDNNKGILECKTTQRAVDADDLPKHWFCQVQYQLGTAELTQGSIAWLTQGREFGYKDLSLVPEFYGWLVEEVDKFWTDNIVGKQEPSAVSVQDVLLKYNRQTDSKVIEVSEEIFNAYSSLKSVKNEIAALEEKKTELEERIKLGFGDAEAISYGGQTLATWKAPKDSEKFDAKAFQAAYPDLAKEFTKTVAGVRRFLLK